jgi:hypothetical protein
MNCEGLDEASLLNAIYDKKTVWPVNFNPKAKGAVEIQK